MGEELSVGEGRTHLETFPFLPQDPKLRKLAHINQKIWGFRSFADRHEEIGPAS
jgi:hypothetical protein